MDFNTYIGEIRGGIGGSGSPIAYKYVSPPTFGGSGTTADIQQGELVGWDATNRVLVRFIRTGGYDFVGVTRDSALSVQKLGNQTALLLTEMSVYTTGIHQFLGTAGDTYNHGDVVYMNNSGAAATAAQRGATQMVMKSGLGTAVQIGVVWLPTGTQVVGAALVPVAIDNYTTKQAG